MAESSDPIEFELFKNAIFSIADEMALTVFRTTYSGVLKDNMDYSTGFCRRRRQARGAGPDPAGPSRLGADGAWTSIMRHFGDDMAPGDVFIMNDPFDGGMHLPDIFVFKPLYHEGERLAFACTVCHHTDVGGRVAGSNASDSTEIYAEGPAHRADEALRGGQAQQDHHDVHREERAPAGAGVRRPARPARRLPHRRDAVRRAGGALRRRSRPSSIMQRDASTMPSA